MRIALAAVLLAALSTSAPLRAQEGKLRKVRDEVNAAPAPDSCANDDDGESWIGELIGGAVQGCFWMLGEAFQLEEADDGTPLARFRRYPYADGGAGLMALPSLGTPPKHADASDDWRGGPPLAHGAPAPVLHRCCVRLLLEDSNDFSGVNRVNGQVFVETSSRLGVQAGWSWLHERLAGGGHDRMTLGNAALTFRFLESENLLLRVGAGFRWLADDDSSFGFNLLASGDYFPIKPLVLSACIDGGSLGSTSALHLRGTAGVVYRHYELFTGYDWLRIGAVDLHGPVAGLRLWF